MDPAELITKFAKSLDADYPMLADPDGAVARSYGVVNEGRTAPNRWTFYISKDGKILYVDRDVKVSTAGADVAARLARLRAPRKPS